MRMVLRSERPFESGTRFIFLALRLCSFAWEENEFLEADAVAIYCSAWSASVAWCMSVVSLYLCN